MNDNNIFKYGIINYNRIIMIIGSFINKYNIYNYYK